MINAAPLPDGSLLQVYRDSGAFTDCYVTQIDSPVSLPQFITAFYSSRLFGLERLILKWAVKKPSTATDICNLASGTTRDFAAWTVENRTDNQVLLSDFRRTTRSWLMVEPLSSGARNSTFLYFGSAVTPTTVRASGPQTMSFTFRALLGFHKAYSRALLKAARSRLKR